MIIENPYNPSGDTYLENNFIPPTIIDKNRMLRGDYFVKPTGYWYINCAPTYGRTEQKDKKQKIVYKEKSKTPTGICSAERSALSSDYARNFLCDFVLGREQMGTQLDLFKPQPTI